MPLLRPLTAGGPAASRHGPHRLTQRTAQRTAQSAAHSAAIRSSLPWLCQCVRKSSGGDAGSHPAGLGKIDVSEVRCHWPAGRRARYVFVASEDGHGSRPLLPGCAQEYGRRDGRPVPAAHADEHAMPETWPDFHRATLTPKCPGLKDDQSRLAAAPPSSMTLLGLVQHLAEVERTRFPRVPSGQHAPPCPRGEQRQRLCPSAGTWARRGDGRVASEGRSRP